MSTITRKIAWTGIMLLSISGASTQCTTNKGEAPLRNSILWRITGKDLPSPSFLFGTVHVIDPEDFSIHPTVVEQLLRSETVFFETDLSEPDYQKMALSFAMMNEDSLDGILLPAEYEVLETFFRDEFDFPLAAVKHMKPFYLTGLIGALQAEPDSRSYEEEFLKIARKVDLKTGGISTLERESGLLDRIPLESAIDYLFDELEAYRDGRSDHLKNQILEAYEKRNIEQIYTLMSGSLENHPAVLDQMFPVRNASWLSSMVDFMHEGSCFFAVGVGHLPGESGLIRLLRKEGFRVVPVNMDL